MNQDSGTGISREAKKYAWSASDLVLLEMAGFRGHPSFHDVESRVSECQSAGKWALIRWILLWVRNRFGGVLVFVFMIGFGFWAPWQLCTVLDLGVGLKTCVSLGWFCTVLFLLARSPHLERVGRRYLAEEESSREEYRMNKDLAEWLSPILKRGKDQ